MRHAILDPKQEAIVLAGADTEDLDRLRQDAQAAVGDLPAAFELARALGDRLPLPGEGRTAYLWSALATLGSVDLTVARAIEPHLDAIAITQQARAAQLLDEDLPSGTYGVFAAEGPGVRLEFEDGRLSGTKPWCSLASVLDAALVTAWQGDERRLYAVSLRADGVRAESGGWASRGLVEVPSLAVHFDGVPAVPVGPAGWYLDRPGFAWGGIGVAAIWFGAAVAVGRRLVPRAGGRKPDQIALMHAGEAELELACAASVLSETARVVDDGDSTADDARRLALTARGAVARAVESVLTRTGRGTGPAPLTADEEHARRVADLTVYVRQDHAERDAAALGGLLAP
ncbi:acyl-CoA dehydrogenase [Calidifontibacter sp. DB0510]|uniref:Acyl-CoA dehydrogenase n=1 Tax=Metallococcus carri TaxID=1656884 RepID=A0A967B080_9MICO|nr:acyl-CoA dehydrogenase [Metallococcus carri]NHN54850.1 acyl-CoA dehydrogenase [Metallococcus carri]NOP37195.1 acyl-CoA dehydrogenase [Calidifontibacter sp. DB2511S]